MRLASSKEKLERITINVIIFIYGNTLKMGGGGGGGWVYIMKADTAAQLLYILYLYISLRIFKKENSTKMMDERRRRGGGFHIRFCNTDEF